MTKKKTKTQKDLTPKQAAFCLEYLKDHNATQAAIRAGYSKSGADVRGSELLGNRKVQEELGKVLEKVETKAIVTIQDALSGLRNEAESGKNPGGVKVTAWGKLLDYMANLADKPQTNGNGHSKPAIDIHIHEKPARVVIHATDSDTDADTRTG